MRTFKDQIKSISLLLATLILFQSCATYKTPITLQQAVQEEKAVKIVTVDDDTYKYKYIVYEDGQFYGVKNNPGEDVKFAIDTEEVADVLMKKKGLPWWAWVLIVYGFILLAGLVLFAGVDKETGNIFDPYD